MKFSPSTFALAGCLFLLFPSAPSDLHAQHRWSNPNLRPYSKYQLPDSVRHGTFRSPSMEVEVGYCIYFPPDYEESEKRFPVIYMLHGGQGTSDERYFLKMVPSIEALRKGGESMPAIYVFVNGGAVSFYNIPAKKSMGEDVLIRELIPHIDETYRTIAERSGRGIEGHSGGGRAVARIVFAYPELFGSAIASCGGFSFEREIAETGSSGNLTDVLPGHNTFDRARHYAKSRKPEIPLLIIVGTRDRWYQDSIDYMAFLDTLEIPYEKDIVENAGHGPTALYPKAGKDFIDFHKRHLAEPKE